MTMQITAKDVGRVAVDRDGDEWAIVAFNQDAEFPVVARMSKQAEVFRSDGRWSNDGTRLADLILFADEPEAKPPETVEIEYNSAGYVISHVDYTRRPDLAGKSFTYRIEGEK